MRVACGFYQGNSYFEEDSRRMTKWLDFPPLYSDLSWFGIVNIQGENGFIGSPFWRHIFQAPFETRQKHFCVKFHTPEKKNWRGDFDAFARATFPPSLMNLLPGEISSELLGQEEQCQIGSDAIWLFSCSWKEGWEITPNLINDAERFFKRLSFCCCLFWS